MYFLVVESTKCSSSFCTETISGFQEKHHKTFNPSCSFWQVLFSILLNHHGNKHHQRFYLFCFPSQKLVFSPLSLCCVHSFGVTNHPCALAPSSGLWHCGFETWQSASDRISFLGWWWWWSTKFDHPIFNLKETTRKSWGFRFPPRLPPVPRIVWFSQAPIKPIPGVTCIQSDITTEKLGNPVTKKSFLDAQMWINIQKQKIWKNMEPNICKHHVSFFKSDANKNVFFNTAQVSTADPQGASWRRGRCGLARRSAQCRRNGLRNNEGNAKPQQAPQQTAELWEMPSLILSASLLNKFTYVLKIL